MSDNGHRDQPPPEGFGDCRVLVTGAGGFLGARLCARLVDLGAEVFAVSRGERPDRDGVRWLRADLGHANDCRRVVSASNPGHVFHLASLVKGSRDRALVAPTFEANLATTVHLLDAVAARGCERFVQIGSLEEPDSADETPCSPYAAAKAAASGYARMFERLYGLPVSLARVFMVYGPGRQDEAKLVPYVIRALLAEEEIVLSSGTRRVDWVYVDDVIEGLLRMALSEATVGERVDLGSGRLTPIAEVVRRLFALLAPERDVPLGTLPDRPAEVERIASVEETRKLLGWAPSTDLDAGLRQTVDWFEANQE